jgi:heme/copper-type cytochrome/quinol oxidase subunit 2
MIAYTASGWTQVIVAISIFAPVAVALAITIFVLRGMKNDPDERRWRHQAEERKRLEREGAERPE